MKSLMINTISKKKVNSTVFFHILKEFFDKLLYLKFTAHSIKKDPFFQNTSLSSCPAMLTGKIQVHIYKILVLIIGIYKKRLTLRIYATTAHLSELHPSLSNTSSSRYLNNMGRGALLFFILILYLLLINVQQIAASTVFRLLRLNLFIVLVAGRGIV